MHYGFTGTREGMTELQKHRVEFLLFPAKWLSHGDCVGADADAHRIAVSMGIKISRHPPIIKTNRAYCEPFDLDHKPRVYGDRNEDIVDRSDRMLATPKAYYEERRGSGTWNTVRYARMMEKPLAIVWPDGTVRYERWP